MIVSIIGSNGLLSSEIGIYCNNNNFSVYTYGLGEPKSHKSVKYFKTNLLEAKLDFEELVKSDLIVYASGAGIQSNLSESYNDIYYLNTLMPISICKELSNLSFKGTFVTFGSYFEIGNNSNEVKFSEVALSNSSLSVPNDYCISKRLLTKYVISANNTFKHIHLVLPTIYGEREGIHRLIPYTISNIKNNEIPQFTNGEQIRQYLYVGDIPKIIFHLMENNIEGMLNLPGEETYSIREIIHKIFKYYNLECSNMNFGTASRPDVGMLNLQLCSNLSKKALHGFKYSEFNDVLIKYDQCL
jgi:nucleoside-diphosphate-sugar epimerase